MLVWRTGSGVAPGPTRGPCLCGVPPSEHGQNLGLASHQQNTAKTAGVWDSGCAVPWLRLGDGTSHLGKRLLFLFCFAESSSPLGRPTWPRAEGNLSQQPERNCSSQSSNPEGTKFFQQTQVWKQTLPQSRLGWSCGPDGHFDGSSVRP